MTSEFEAVWMGFRISLVEIVNPLQSTTSCANIFPEGVGVNPMFDLATNTSMISEAGQKPILWLWSIVYHNPQILCFV